MTRKKEKMIKNASVVDLFCGAGGLSLGLKNAGFPIKLGVDLDKHCEFPFTKNIGAKFLEKDIKELTSENLKEAFKGAKFKILVGCAPCQSFSPHTHKVNHEGVSKWSMLSEFLRLITESQPDIVSMENVPQIRNYNDGESFQSFVKGLENEGYNVSWKIVFCPDYGIPQNRKRLVLLASKHGEIHLIPPTHTKDKYISVKEAIGHLPKLKAGTSDKKDTLHKAANLSEINFKRIRASKPGGSWRDWPKELLPECYRRESGKSYGSVYGRMKWNKPSPTITTQFYGYGTGRFGHPTQARALSLREGAILQSFPENYMFLQEDEKIHTTHVARLIGNAVPVKLGEAIGKSITRHLQS